MNQIVPDWERLSQDLRSTLPKPLNKARSELLPQILEEWWHTELREHLSKPSLVIIRERIGHLVKIHQRAIKLHEALIALDEHGRTALLAQFVNAEGPCLEKIGKSAFVTQEMLLKDALDTIRKLAAVRPKEFWNVRRGQPRNIAAYRVLQDAAAIFEWITTKVATREVDRNTTRDTGPFYKFASILWPAIFGKGLAGLPAAMKNWDAWRSKHHERSALLANISLRNQRGG
jgi:hypothetical protein